MKKTVFYFLVAISFLLTVFANGKSITPDFNFKVKQYSYVSKPSNGSVRTDAVSLKVTANIISGATHYTIELSKKLDFSDSILVQTSKQDNQRTLTFTRLKYSTRYYARVKTNLSPAYGEITSFTTRPEEFSTLSLPANGTAGVDFAILKIIVSPVYQAKRYTIQLSLNPGFSDAVISKTSLTDLQQTFAVKLKEHTTYYARVITDVSTRYGDPTSFTTRYAVSQRRFWGVTTSGGEANAGTVFSFSLDSLTYTKHHDNVSCEYLHGNLTPAPEGSFYGMGIQNSTGDAGEVYKISADGSYSLISNGGIHFGSLMLASDNNLYVVEDWMNLFRGSISRLDPETTARKVIYKFRSETGGKNPCAAPIEFNDYLYGMAPNGGEGKRGIIYRKKFDGPDFQVMYNFRADVGASPQGSLIQGTDGYLYGLTFSGGAANFGTIFKIMPDGSNFTKLLDFNGTNGKYPFGDLIQYGDLFYGMTSAGGTSNNGVIFRINSNGSAFEKLLDFNGINGSAPHGNLTVDGTAGILYGMTSMGGVNDLGVIFKINANGSSFSKLYDFSTGGGNPDGGLVLVEDSFKPVASPSARSITNNNQNENLIARENEGVKIYPNPFINNITVELPSSVEEKFNITMTDLNGRIVLAYQTNQTLQLGDNLSQGVYLMKIVNGSKVSMHRVVKGTPNY